MNSFTMNSRRGMAIVIALFFAFCMIILVVAMLFKQSSSTAHNQMSLLEKQSFFAARSAMQHFLLKSKLFSEELYDAVELSQGKNPLVNFAEFPSTDYKGKELFKELEKRQNLYIKLDDSEVTSQGNPKYYYTKLPNRESFIRLGSFHNPKYRFLAPYLAQENPEKKYTEPKTVDDSYYAWKYLSYYCRDCSNIPIEDKELQPALEMVKETSIQDPNKFDIAKRDGYPYTLGYLVLDIKVKPIEGIKKRGEEVIEIRVEGSATNFQGKEYCQSHVRTEVITRKGSI